MASNKASNKPRSTVKRRASRRSAPSAETVRAQYEAYPYPPRDPGDEKNRLITGSPSHVLELNHYVFGGRRDFTAPFRALVAGGGTGDGAIMLAQQLAEEGAGSEVIYLDVSAAAMATARARAETRGLTNIRFHRASLLDLATLDLGRFDYVDCCGVLHHLDDPALGLQRLSSVLADRGGIGLMVYGKLGRTGVYETQALIRLMAGDADDEQRLAVARTLIKALPPTNWFIRNPHIGDHRNAGDAGLYDLLLHSRDRAFTVPELAELVSGAGLAITAFIEPARYDPANYLAESPLRDRLASLPWLDSCAAAELIAGNLKRHICYLVRPADAPQAVARPDSPEVVPILKDAAGADLAKRVGRAGGMSIDFDGVKVRFTLPEHAGAILAAVDGRHNLRAIHEAVARGPRRLDWLAFKSAFDRLYAALNGLNIMLLRQPESGRR
jgi:SAM-dependent methyltransferase